MYALKNVESFVEAYAKTLDDDAPRILTEAQEAVSPTSKMIAGEVMREILRSNRLYDLFYAHTQQDAEVIVGTQAMRRLGARVPL